MVVVGFFKVVVHCAEAGSGFTGAAEGVICILDFLALGIGLLDEFIERVMHVAPGALVRVGHLGFATAEVIHHHGFQVAAAVALVDDLGEVALGVVLELLHFAEVALDLDCNPPKINRGIE